MIEFKYGRRKFNIKPYDTKTQKDIVIFTELCSNFDENALDNVLKILGVSDFEPKLTLDEKISLLYKIRSISVGEKLVVNSVCPNCKNKQMFELDISDIVMEPDSIDNSIIDNYKEFDEKDVQSYIHEDVNELDLDQYDDLINKIKRSIVKFNFLKDVRCVCGKSFKINLKDIKLCIKSLSDESLKAIYETYNNLTYYSHYTKMDVDSMYPFERAILIAMLNETIKKINESRKSK